IVDEDFGEELAPGTKLDVELQAGRIEAEQLPQDALAAERRRHFLQVYESHVGIRRFGERLQKLRSDVREKMPAGTRGQERDVLLGQEHKVLKSALHIAEGIAPEHRLNAFGLRIRIEN